MFILAHASYTCFTTAYVQPHRHMATNPGSHQIHILHTFKHIHTDMYSYILKHMPSEQHTHIFTLVLTLTCIYILRHIHTGNDILHMVMDTQKHKYTDR